MGTNKKDYIAQVQVAVSQLHNCGATWRETVPVHEVFRGETVWQGDVEVFDLTGLQKPNALTHGVIWTARKMNARDLSLCWKFRRLFPLKQPCGCKL
jgi:hypothetical protein